MIMWCRTLQCNGPTTYLNHMSGLPSTMRPSVYHASSPKQAYYCLKQCSPEPQDHLKHLTATRCFQSSPQQRAAQISNQQTSGTSGSHPLDTQQCKQVAAPSSKSSLFGDQNLWTRLHHDTASYAQIIIKSWHSMSTTNSLQYLLPYLCFNSKIKSPDLGLMAFGTKMSKNRWIRRWGGVHGWRTVADQFSESEIGRK